MRHLPVLLIAILSLAACSNVERAENITAEMEAAQMEGRRAAREFINANWSDTLELQRKLLKARSQQSKYTIDHRDECAAAFDSGFVRTLRAVRPEVARLLDKPSSH